MRIKVLVLIGVLAMLAFSVGPVFAVKPADNLASAETVPWNLSADVMPVPPYGSMDIPGSDTASKLIVNQPNGAVEVALTGVMNGLNPNTVYTVYISKGYEPYVYTGWNIEGAWIMRAVLGSNYDHDYLVINQIGTTFSGTGGYPATGPPYTYTETVSGTIDPMTGDLTMHSVYNNGYWYDAVAAIASDGTISGTWGNTGQGYGHPWYSLSGQATDHTGDTGWPGLLSSTVQPFTFTTDEFGSASWHINLRDDDFSGPGTYEISVWINTSGLTMLISDTFEVVVS